MDPLSLVDAHLSADEPARALSAAIDAWREIRAPEIEALIDRLSEHLDRSVLPLDPSRSLDLAFLDRAAAGRPEDVPLLLQHLTKPPKGGIPRRMRALLDRGPDPRVGRALVAAIAEPPTTASSNFSMWTAMFEALPRFVDTRQRPRSRIARRNAADGRSSGRSSKPGSDRRCSACPIQRSCRPISARSSPPSPRRPPPCAKGPPTPSPPHPKPLPPPPRPHRPPPSRTSGIGSKPTTSTTPSTPWWRGGDSAGTPRSQPPSSGSGGWSTRVAPR